MRFRAGPGGCVGVHGTAASKGKHVDSIQAFFVVGRVCVCLRALIMQFTHAVIIFCCCCCCCCCCVLFVTHPVRRCGSTCHPFRGSGAGSDQTKKQVDNCSFRRLPLFCSMFTCPLCRVLYDQKAGACAHRAVFVAPRAFLIPALFSLQICGAFFFFLGVLHADPPALARRRIFIPVCAHTHS